MSELIKKIAIYIFSDLSNCFSIMYILLLLIGIAFEYNYYILFNINILQYADIIDFLLTPIREYWAIVFLLVNCLFSFGLFKMDIWWRAKYPESYKKMNFGMNTNTMAYNIYSLASILSIFIFYIYKSADVYGHIKKDGIVKGKGQAVIFTDNENHQNTYFLIGKTGDYIFLYDEKKQVLIKKFEEGATMQVANFSNK